MAVVNSLAAETLSLRGADFEYHKFSRIFRTKGEALAALDSGEWMPDGAVLNICLTGDEGLQVYHPNDTVNPLHTANTDFTNYVDTKISDLVGGAPDAMDTFAEIATALNNNPGLFTALDTRITALEEGPDFTAAITAPVDANIIPFYHDSVSTLPDAATWHGAMAHAHDTGKMYYAHASQWNELANKVELDAANMDIQEMSSAIGITDGDVDMGTFPGSIISDSVSAKTALTELEAAVTALQPANSGIFVQVHGSFNGSTGAAFDFANDEIESYGVSDITRVGAGHFQVTFSSPFASANYTVIGQAGDQDYSGVNSSPRTVCVLNRTTTTVDILCERTDDAVNDDNGYIAFMIMGTLA